MVEGSVRMLRKENAMVTPRMPWRKHGVRYGRGVVFRRHSVLVAAKRKSVHAEGAKKSAKFRHGTFAEPGLLRALCLRAFIASFFDYTFCPNHSEDQLHG